MATTENTPAALQTERKKDAHETEACSKWLQEKVSLSRSGVADGTNKTISAKEWANIRAAKKTNISEPLAHKKRLTQFI